MYSLAVRMRDTVLPPTHAAAVNSFRMSRASFLVGSPMMRDLSGAFSGPDRESVYLGECFPAFAADGVRAHVFSLAVMAVPVPFAGEYPGEVFMFNGFKTG